ncbi:MAG: hypothetical protein Q6368_007340 [Candidatus Baldrarchaeota archaeon]
MGKMWFLSLINFIFGKHRNFAILPTKRTYYFDFSLRSVELDFEISGGLVVAKREKVKFCGFCG